jgi:Cu2+-exporting ATPase
MGCCGNPDAESISQKAEKKSASMRNNELSHFAHRRDDGDVEYVFSVPGIKCGRCMGAIERALAERPDVREARVNLTLKRVTVVLDGGHDSPTAIVDSLNDLGYPATPLELGNHTASAEDAEASRLLRALAVAGFAAGNIMLLSVSVWSGADGTTRDLFHLISALIAIPTVFYSGQVFFLSAFNALAHGRLNMDVPISLAVILALAMSVFETLTGGAEAYFDAAVTLLFFLLIGRYLDTRMRDKARSAVIGLSRMAVKGANRITPDGTLEYIPIDEISAGMLLRVAPGERVPVDGVIRSGSSDLDRSLVTGENAPIQVSAGSEAEAGTLNLTGSIDLEAARSAKNSFLSEVMRMLEAAERGRGRYVRIADQMARIYAPAVHALSALAFIGWMFVTGGDWYTSLYIAISVLIITCPCALGLAVPVVHVIGAARLFEEGILVKDGSALERLAGIDRVLFDKTGTLTTSEPEAIIDDSLGETEQSVSRALAQHSLHPAARAVATAIRVQAADGLSAVREEPGHGIEAIWKNQKVRLGRAEWVSEITSKDLADTGDTAFAIEGKRPAIFAMRETVRPNASEMVNQLKKAGISTEILSGDERSAVTRLAHEVSIPTFQAGCRPDDKLAYLEAISAAGGKAMMVGDGLNDAPSLAAAHVSMAPASASDVGRMAADFVFTRPGLDAVTFAYAIAIKAGRLVKQNFALAILYNCIAVPLAIGGLVTPLFAAIAMSASSVVVVANSLRLLRLKPEMAVGKTSNENAFSGISKFEPTSGRPA